MIHVEVWVEGDEFGSYQVGIESCDVCGEVIDIEENEHFVRMHWDQRDNEAKLRTERLHRENAPTPEEIVDAWIACIPQGAPFEKWSWKARPPQTAAGSFSKLFAHTEYPKIFSAFMERMQGPDRERTRWAAISLYSQLRTHVPVSYEPGFRISEITGAWLECDDCVPDHSAKNDTRRRLFSAMLAEIVGSTGIERIEREAQVEAELSAACAAAEWDRARNIMNSAIKKNLLAPDQAEFLRLQFELLLAVGKHLDALLVSDPGSTTGRLLKALNRSFEASEHRFALDQLENSCTILEWSGRGSRRRWQDVAFVLPLLDAPLPVIQERDAWSLGNATEKAEAIWRTQPERGLLLRVLCAYSLEARDKKRRALEQYQFLLDMTAGPYSGRLRELLKCKVAELLQAVGEPEAARSLLHSVDTSKELRPPASRVIHLALSLGETKTIRAILENVTDARERYANEPLLRLILEPESEDLFSRLASVEAECSKWETYQTLSAAAKNCWCTAVIHGRSSEKFARHSVGDYALAVEIELRLIFDEFKRDNGHRTKGWAEDRVLAAADEKFSAWLTGRSLTMGDMAKVLKRANGETHEAFRALAHFLYRRCGKLLTRATLEALSPLVPARNAAFHEGSTKIGPSKAHGLATIIIEALHSA